jgi:phospholipase C
MNKIFLITGTASERGGHGEPSVSHTTLVHQNYDQQENWFAQTPLVPAFSSEEKAKQYIKDNRLSTHWCKIISLDVI